MKKCVVKETELDNELYNYLDALLNNVPTNEEVHEEIVIKDPVIIPTAKDENMGEELSVTETTNHEQISEEKSSLMDGGIFKALLFKVGDMAMMVPMVELRGVASWPGKLTKMKGGRSSYLGLTRRNGVNINVLDTCYLLGQMGSGSHCYEEINDYLNLIMIGDGTSGLACHGVVDIVDVEPEKIKWRKTRKSRPWYLGIDAKRMSILLDVSELISAANEA